MTHAHELKDILKFPIIIQIETVTMEFAVVSRAQLLDYPWIIPVNDPTESQKLFAQKGKGDGWDAGVLVSEVTALISRNRGKMKSLSRIDLFNSVPWQRRPPGKPGPAAGGVVVVGLPDPPAEPKILKPPLGRLWSIPCMLSRDGSVGRTLGFLWKRNSGKQLTKINWGVISTEQIKAVFLTELSDKFKSNFGVVLWYQVELVKVLLSLFLRCVVDILLDDWVFWQDALLCFGLENALFLFEYMTFVGQ
ncbi:hypothetical protein E6O75_ATG00873 [Venturia nashicola]|uniref:Uncharacterized protein n=1 Tax=Venturia nashicola TaxID=86259 RepID=A0A4Z1PC70_9PEZI|nr:hypothetical protein E6O75_ATG00873 [Venturia nashicola]